MIFFKLYASIYLRVITLHHLVKKLQTPKLGTLLSTLNCTEYIASEVSFIEKLF